MSDKNSFVRSEDVSAIVVGAFFLLIGLALFYTLAFDQIKSEQDPLVADLQQSAAGNSNFKTVAWFESFDKLQSLQGQKTNIGEFLRKLTDKPGSWKSNPLHSMQMSSRDAAKISDQATIAYDEYVARLAELKRDAVEAENKARESGFKDPQENAVAKKRIAEWRSVKADGAGISKKYKASPFSKWPYLLMLFTLFLLLFGAAVYWMGEPIKPFAKGFIAVFLFAVFSHFLAGQSSIKDMGIGYAAWAILLGLIISNTIGTAAWIKPALQTELYIKTGLVILGAEILMSKILAIGLPGIFVAWVVTPIVLVTTFWFGQKVLKISSKTLNITISADMSVCGVSAAVATAAACKATKEELTLAIGLSMVFTSVMMILMPIAINAMGMPEVLGGAWMGGTIDATGAVVAAGAFLGNDALNVAATIKMIQNILIGVIAFGVAIYFTRMGAETGAKVGVGEIWRRFPKFVLGFIGASIIFSIIYSFMNDHMAYSLLDEGVIGGYSSHVRGWLFCLAFVSIGLSTNFKELKKHFTGGKPFILYVCGQAFNLMLTLLVAYIMFYLVFPEITEAI